MKVNIISKSDSFTCSFEAKDEELDFALLQKMLEENFPIYTAEERILLWQDSDGDMITFSSEEEFKEALRSATNNELNVYIKVTELDCFTEDSSTQRHGHKKRHQNHCKSDTVCGHAGKDKKGHRILKLKQLQELSLSMKMQGQNTVNIDSAVEKARRKLIKCCHRREKKERRRAVKMQADCYPRHKHRYRRHQVDKDVAPSLAALTLTDESVHDKNGTDERSDPSGLPKRWKCGKRRRHDESQDFPSDRDFTVEMTDRRKCRHHRHNKLHHRKMDRNTHINIEKTKRCRQRKFLRNRMHTTPTQEQDIA